MAKGGSLTPEQVYSVLEETAVDMGTPGYDRDSGFGLIDANAAVGRVITHVVYIGTGNVNEITGSNGREALTGTPGPDRITGGIVSCPETPTLGVGALGHDLDMLTGGGGSDEFMYHRLRDRGDIITGEDFINLLLVVARSMLWL
ncbi:MAG: hypothetical protein GDA43_11235 [Hormoscilla sp. SP5CHS1]|nr:hypothetical protein [Hormoscilla sp. SP5CHS1]